MKRPAWVRPGDFRQRRYKQRAQLRRNERAKAAFRRAFARIAPGIYAAWREAGERHRAWVATMPKWDTNVPDDGSAFVFHLSHDWRVG